MISEGKSNSVISISLYPIRGDEEIEYPSPLNLVIAFHIAVLDTPKDLASSSPETGEGVHSFNFFRTSSLTDRNLEPPFFFNYMA
jgi:hypothetical protein